MKPLGGQDDQRTGNLTTRARIGFHASHEQFTPGALLACVQAAEAAGFHAAMSADHFRPWSARQGQSGFAWSWLGAAMQATGIPFGVVTTPGYRYHPAILAQAGATLAEMFPNRFWMALGSGEALNETVTGTRWPAKSERNARLEECVGVIRALWAGETVTHHGFVDLEEAELYTRAEEPPRIIGAALTPPTAKWLARWADGLITINQPRPKMQQVIDAFREGGGEHKPIFLQSHLSFAATDDEARRHAYEQWRSNSFPPAVAEELRTPGQFDAAATLVRPDDLDKTVRISADIRRHADWVDEDIAMGFREIYLHNVGPNQQAFIDAFGERVLPALC